MMLPHGLQLALIDHRAEQIKQSVQSNISYSYHLEACLVKQFCIQFSETSQL